MALSEGVSRKTGSVMRAGDGATHGTSTRPPVKASGMGIASPRALGGKQGPAAGEAASPFSPIAGLPRLLALAQQ